MDIRRAGMGLALLLILANAWKWWPSVDAQLRGRDVSEGRLFSVEDFQVHGLTMENPSKSERDLFHVGKSRSGASLNAAGLDRRTVTEARSSKVHEGLAKSGRPDATTLSAHEADKGRTQIEQIKCIGVLFRENSKPEAYVVLGEQHYILRPGDVLEGEFEVKKITLEAVYLKDRQTGVISSVPVDGKEGVINE
jgi:hypothetical protein